MKSKMLIKLLILFLCMTGVCHAQNERRLNENKQSIKLATWNIGHFSKGKKDYSLISPSECAKKTEEYRSFVYNSIKADILCLNEYESEFCIDSISGTATAEDAIFDNYNVHRVFKQNRYICNAIFSNIGLNNTRKKAYSFNKELKAQIKRIDWYYYVSSEIIIDGEKVMLICTHLISGVDKYSRSRQDQIDELIKACEQYKRVIICGDMNTRNYSKFMKAGYTLANDGSIVTFPSKSSSLDNIMVKGLKISDVRVLKTDLSDHYPLTCRISLK